MVCRNYTPTDGRQSEGGVVVIVETHADAAEDAPHERSARREAQTLFRAIRRRIRARSSRNSGRCTAQSADRASTLRAVLPASCLWSADVSIQDARAPSASAASFVTVFQLRADPRTPSFRSIR